MAEATISFVRDNSKLEKVVSNKLFWLLFVALMFAYPIYKSMNRVLPPPLPVITKVPEFELTNEFGKPFGSKQLKGRAYIASFFFTTCPTTCPKLMKDMQVIQKRVRGLGNKVALLSFTVDPEYDKPKVLHKYARNYHANPYIWNFMTGNQQELENLLIKGFKVPMGKGKEEVKGVVDGKEVTLFDIVHTEKLVLVDGKGNIRGYYSSDKHGINKLMIELGLLVNREIN